VGQIYVYKVVISVFFVCMSDQNLETFRPICLKFVFGNSIEPGEYSKLGFKILRLAGWFVLAKFRF